MMGALVGGHSSCKAHRTDTEGAPTHVVNGELASLYFIEQFRKVYIGEHAKQVVQQQVNERLANVLGLEDENAVLTLLINKIGLNLQKRYQLEQVVKRTLLLFHELAAGINIVHASDRSPHLIVSGRLLLKNDMVKFVLGNHASSTFAFLHVGPQYGKYRTMYYHSLAKLLFMDIRDSKTGFDEFMKVHSATLNELWTRAHQPGALRAAECKSPLIGLCRDLRGICMACGSCETYNLLFEWLVDNPKDPMNTRICVFAKALEVWWDDYEVTTPLIKFMAEFVYNKSQRITFDQSSPNGILLFREASKILITYGNLILQKTGFTDIYKEKYKGVGNALEMFARALHGNYTNFGVFELYGDQSLSQSLQLSLRLCLSIPFNDLQAYLKTLKSYYQFMELATRSHMNQMMQLTPDMLATILRSIEEGLLSFDTGVSMQCCAAVDNSVHYFYETRSKPGTEGDAVRAFLALQPSPIKRMLVAMVGLVVSGEFSSTWSISRPMLGLILLQEQTFNELKEHMVQNQIPEKQQKMRQCLTDLMEGVKEGLNAKNKDQFTRNLYTFAQVVRTIT